MPGDKVELLVVKKLLKEKLEVHHLQFLRSHPLWVQHVMLRMSDDHCFQLTLGL
ncbi:hypothetical protein A2U01_0113079 [Trifolium medium]|uniref:Uncharacterized protein n=1 Tax=Trifolium medium TaxID=97028 RepID=A0A392VTQ5_9FABA|nr:hypothetical protein [Trifolium medium]